MHQTNCVEINFRVANKEALQTGDDGLRGFYNRHVSAVRDQLNFDGCAFQNATNGRGRHQPITRAHIKCTGMCNRASTGS